MTEKRETETVVHQFPPVFDDRSRVLILGTMPSPKSREQGFYYGHPRNRFWPVLSMILGEPLPETINEKRDMALKHGIAVWDVLASCEIRGADDTSIRNPVPNDMCLILSQAPIHAVFTTGTKATALFRKYCEKTTGMSPIPLPSTSPANCRISLEELAAEYSKILEYL
ncbi:MAG TPA: DNA-deoxyinosine glycosylase [Candidatus Lachnoclostridium stercorigallinarum]|uniref:DNA-deoxyinosine glycosylase n=1 Tax=Candidatus Lachnoclostridium stercorigallinarum TaxID=2838634 RepID=A0A9D2GG68_9FIRM|nr:DNA-deoxyinosine glycosylase [Candidatus Lachnoclostridium stercorigallinarum]